MSATSPTPGKAHALRRFRLLLDAYGLSLAERREVAEAILDNHDWCSAIITDAASAGHPGFIDYWGRVAGAMARARLVRSPSPRPARLGGLDDPTRWSVVAGSEKTVTEDHSHAAGVTVTGQGAGTSRAMIFALVIPGGGFFPGQSGWPGWRAPRRRSAREIARRCAGGIAQP